MNPHESDDLHSRVLSDRHNWQSIETAPRAGRAIVVLRWDADVVMVRFGCLTDFLPADELERLDPGEYPVAWDEDWFSLGVMGGDRLEGEEVPTHWILPEEPQEAR